MRSIALPISTAGIPVPTVTLRNRSSGRTMIVNETDYALGSIPGVRLGGDWERIGETRGTDAGAQIARDARGLAQALQDRHEAVATPAKDSRWWAPLAKFFRR